MISTVHGTYHLNQECIKLWAIDTEIWFRTNGRLDDAQTPNFVGDKPFMKLEM